VRGQQWKDPAQLDGWMRDGSAAGVEGLCEFRRSPYLDRTLGFATLSGMPTLSSDLDDPNAVPYFLWDDPMTVTELRKRLVESSEPERIRLLGKVLREARDTEVWRFTTPADVDTLFPRLAPHLGRRREFWEFLLGQWRSAGLLRG
jgi:hypothetical protein